MALRCKNALIEENSGVGSTSRRYLWTLCLTERREESEAELPLKATLGVPTLIGFDVKEVPKDSCTLKPRVHVCTLRR